MQRKVSISLPVNSQQQINNRKIQKLIRQAKIKVEKVKFKRIKENNSYLGKSDVQMRENKTSHRPSKMKNEAEDNIREGKINIRLVILSIFFFQRLFDPGNILDHS